MELNSELRKKLKAYSALAASMLASGVASAQIQYHDIEPDLQIPSGILGYFNLDLNNDGVTDFRIQKDFRSENCTTSSYTTYYGASTVIQYCTSVNNLKWLNLNSGNAIEAPIPNWIQQGVDPAILLNDSVTVNNGWNNNPEIKIDFDSNSPQHNDFIGFRIKNGSDFNYGWLRLYHDVNENEIRIKDYAIQQTVNTPILTGEGHDCNNFNPQLYAMTTSCGGAWPSLDVYPKRENYTWYRYNNQWYYQDDYAHLASDEGMYYVIGVDGFGCVDTSNSIYVHLPSWPNWNGPVFNVASNLQIVNDSIVAEPGHTYQWYNYDTPIAEYSNKYLPPGSGIYKVRITNPAQCEVTQTISFFNCATDSLSLVNILPEPCNSILVLVNENNSYIWQQSFLKTLTHNGGSISPSEAQTSPGTYGLTMIGNNGCVETADPLIVSDDVTPMPTVTLVNDTLFSSPADSFQWYTRIDIYSEATLISGATNNFYVPLTNGNYFVEVADSGLCFSASDEITIANCNLIENSSIPTANGVMCLGDYIQIGYDDPNSVFKLFKNNSLVFNSGNTWLLPPDTGIYSVIVENSFNGCIDTIENIMVLPNPPPPVITRLHDTLFCNCNGTTQWFNNQNQPIVGATNNFYVPNGISANAYYRVSCSDTGLCQPALSSYYQNCIVELVKYGDSWCGAINGTMNANFMVNTNYNWYRNDSLIYSDTNPYQTFPVAGNYKVVAINNSGCIDTSNEIVVHAYPFAVDSALQIHGDTLSTNLAGTYEWRFNSNYISGATNQFFIVDRIGSYRVTVTTDSGCTFTSLPVLMAGDNYCGRVLNNLNVNDTVYLCSGSSLNVGGSNGTSVKVQWQKNGQSISGATQNNFIISSSGTYRLILYETMCCADTSESVTVIYLSQPPASTITLQNDTLFSNVTGVNHWYLFGSEIVNETQQFYVPLSGGYYENRVFNDSGCFAHSNQITIQPPPPQPPGIQSNSSGGNLNQYQSNNSNQQSITCDTTLQPGIGLAYNCYSHQKVVLTNFNAASFDWYLNNSFLGNGNAQFVNDTGNYFFIATLSNGCIYYSDTLYAVPAPTFNAPVLSLVNDTLVATTNNGTSTVSWYRISYPSGFVSGYFALNYVPTIEGQYLFFMTDSFGCQINSNTVAYQTCNDSIMLNYINDTMHFCSTVQYPSIHVVGSYTNMGNYGVSFQWFKNNLAWQFATQNTANISQSGSYFLRITKTNGCVEYSDTVNFVVVIDTPVAVTVSEIGDTLVATGNGVFQWFYHDGLDWSSTMQIIPGVTDSMCIPFYQGYYQVILTSSNGCTSNASINYPACRAIQLINACGDVDCNLDPVTLITESFAGSSANYHWYYNGNLIPWSSGMWYMYNATIAGDYFVIHENVNAGCSDTSNVVTVGGASGVNVINNNGVLIAIASVSYQWYLDGLPIAGATNQQYVISESGYYSVEIIDSLGCQFSSSSDLQCVPFPVSVNCSDTTICVGDTTFIHADLGGSAFILEWKKNGIVQWDYTSFDSLPVFSSGNYQAVVYDSAGCITNSNSITVVQNAIPTVTLTYSGDTLFASLGISYQWYLNNVLISGATNQYFIPVNDGLYGVKITDANGCSSEIATLLIDVGIGEFSNLNSISVTPNPSSEFFYVSIGGISHKVKLEVVNMLGEKILEFNPELINNSSSFKINLSEYPAGIYHLNISSEELSQTKKLVLIRN